MAYVASNYDRNPKAPVGQWVCAPTSSLGPYADVPPKDKFRGPDFCGQCVSYVKAVCPTLPATALWKKGKAVREAQRIDAGTVIATFDADGRYDGHAAIYVNHSEAGIEVYDQWVTPPTPRAVSRRLLRWGAHGRSNNGDNFHVVE